MLSLPKLIRSQKGNAVLLLTIGLVAVAGSIALEIQNRKRIIKRQNQQASLQEQSDLIGQVLKTRLHHPETCTAALAGEMIKPGVRASAALHVLVEEQDASVRIGELAIETSAAEDMRTEILDSNGVATPLARYPAFLQPSYVDAEGRPLSAPPTSIPFYVWINPLDGQILSCSGRNSAGSLCNDLGGYFIPDTTPYYLSCRQSFKTERRTEKGLEARGTCRIGGPEASAKNCAKKWGVPFAANLFHQPEKHMQPEMTVGFLCELCQ